MKNIIWKELKRRYIGKRIEKTVLWEKKRWKYTFFINVHDEKVRGVMELFFFLALWLSGVKWKPRVHLLCWIQQICWTVGWTDVWTSILTGSTGTGLLNCSTWKSIFKTLIDRGFPCHRSVTFYLFVYVAFWSKRYFFNCNV